MKTKNKIRAIIASDYDEGYANACHIWRGYGEMGQRPFGWWMRPFGENARYMGMGMKEVQEAFEADSE